MLEGKRKSFLLNNPHPEKLGVLAGLTWKRFQRHVREDVVAAANHNCVKDSALLLAVALGDDLPLARG